MSKTSQGRTPTTGMLRATHEGVMHCGPIAIECAVLEDGRRVVSERAFSRALGRAQPSGKSFQQGRGDDLPVYLAPRNLKAVIPRGFHVATISYRSKDNRTAAIGVEALVIPDVCDVWMDARNAGLLRTNQLPTARAAELISRGFSRVGVIALIDEVTGYDEVKAAERNDKFQQLLQAYVVPEMRPWVRRFPSEFFKQLHRLMGWKEYDAVTAQTPRYAGHLINEWIYKRLPEPVLPELRRLNPPVNGHRRAKHHQFLTADTGSPHLDKQVTAVTVLARASRDLREFEDNLVRGLPAGGDQLPLGTATHPAELVARRTKRKRKHGR